MLAFRSIHAVARWRQLTARSWYRSYVDSRSNQPHHAAITRIVEMELTRSTVILLCAAVLAVSGCTAQKATRSASPATTPTTQPAGLDGCVQPGSADLVEVGGGVQAAVLGTGPAGVVLSNQSDQNLCGWLPFAKTLAARGFRVLSMTTAPPPTRPATSSTPPPSCVSWGCGRSCSPAPPGAPTPR
jgi:hypothetical protein